MDYQEQVINNYLLWELSKRLIHFLIRRDLQSQREIKQSVQRVIFITDNILKKISLENKLNIVEYFSFHRANLFRECSWTKKDYRLNNLGTVLPVCGDLPVCVITKALPEVVEYVKERLKGSNYGISIRYINNLMKIQNILNYFPPIVIEPGNKQRNLNKMKEYYGPGNWNIKQTQAYIEDGNHRAIAMAIITKHESIPCYVGK